MINTIISSLMNNVIRNTYRYSKVHLIKRHPDTHQGTKEKEEEQEQDNRHVMMTDDG